MSDPSTEPAPAPASAPDSSSASLGVPRTRAGRNWVGVAAAILLLIVVLVFIIENLKTVHATFFGVGWRLPLAIDLLLAAVLGGLVVFLLGTTRIVQLRRLARRRRT